MDQEIIYGFWYGSNTFLIFKENGSRIKGAVLLLAS